MRMCAHAGIACALCGVQSRVGCRVNYVMRRSVGRAASDGVAWIHVQDRYRSDDGSGITRVNAQIKIRHPPQLENEIDTHATRTGL